MNDTSDLIPENETNWQNDWQIPYFDNLTEEQQKEITDSIRLLLRQTFVLERKYDKKTERLYEDILDIEERALITSEYKDISVNDMHIMEAIGIQESKNMSTVAKTMSVTVGTLTIAINHLVKKGYVERTRSEEDRRVVLVSLSEKGEKAYLHHKIFHEKMVMAVLDSLNPQETKDLTKALLKLQRFFDDYGKE